MIETCTDKCVAARAAVGRVHPGPKDVPDSSGRVFEGPGEEYQRLEDVTDSSGRVLERSEQQYPRRLLPRALTDWRK